MGSEGYRRIIGDFITGEVLCEAKEGDMVHVEVMDKKAGKHEEVMHKIRESRRGRHIPESAFHKLKPYRYGGKKHGYTQICNEEMRYLLGELEKNEILVLMLLITWLHSDGYCYPGMRKKGISAEQIGKEVGISRKTASKVLNQLAEKGIIHAETEGRGRKYLMNPYVAGKGYGYYRGQERPFKEYAISRGIIRVDRGESDGSGE